MMQTGKYVYVFLFFFRFLIITGQENYNWQRITTPPFSEITAMRFVSADTAILAGKKIYMMVRDSVYKLQSQPPVPVRKMFACSPDCIYVSDNTSYQNSNLYRWNGRAWIHLRYPVANYITDMYFNKENDGILVSYGEILRITPEKSYHLVPPVNTFISQVLMQGNTPVILSSDGMFVYDGKWKPVRQSSRVHRIKMLHGKIYVLGDDYLGTLASDTVHILSRNEIWRRITDITGGDNMKITGVGDAGLFVVLNAGKLSVFNTDRLCDFKQVESRHAYLYALAGDNLLLKYTNEKMPVPVPVWEGFKRHTFNDFAKVIDDEYGVVAADFNADGRTDIYTAGLFEPDHLYINLGHNQFSDQAKTYGLQTEGEKKSDLNLAACAGDLDGDGYIDLYVSMLNGKNKIYKNIKGKYFVDYSKIAGAEGNADDRTNACALADVDNDGDLDIFIADEFTTNRLFLNNGAGIFTEVTRKAGLISRYGGNSASFADMDGDGDEDLYVTNWSAANLLYRNDFIETGELHFTDITGESKTGGEDFAKSNAAVWADMDGDGDMDLLVTNRLGGNILYYNNGKGVFENQMIIGDEKQASYGAVIADFDGNGYKDLYVSNVGMNRLYLNDKGVFKSPGDLYAVQIMGYSTGSALSDFDGDGDTDIYVANYLGESSTLLINRKDDDQYLSLEIKAYKNNRDAIGTKIQVYDESGELIYYDEITAGSGYVSSGDFKRIIPLTNRKKSTVKIVFPDGTSQMIRNLSAGSHLQVRDVEGIRKYFSLTKRFAQRMLLDPYRLFELIKWILVLLLLYAAIGKFRRKHLLSLSKMIAGGLLLLFFYYWLDHYFLYKEYYWGLLPPLTFTGLILFVYYFYDRKYVKRTAELEKQAIKTKLASDLHDDLAATVSSVGFYLTLMRFKLKKGQENMGELLDKSENLLQDATGTIADLIWSFQSKSKNLFELTGRLQRQYATLFREKGIEFKIVNDTDIEQIVLDEMSSRHLFLIMKEALNNILKYAGASKTLISISRHKNTIRIRIQDDGSGFSPEDVKGKGNGLTNMSRRAKEMNAQLHIQSKPGSGTEISVEYTLK